MSRLQLFIVILALVFVGASAVYYFRDLLAPARASLYVDGSPVSQVYIDGSFVGTTPFEGQLKEGEVVVKLVPESGGMPLSPYETRLMLTSGVRTVVRRHFGPTEESSGGEIISFDKYGGDEASISVVTIPDSAQIKIDGTPRGFAPVKITRIVPGEHTVSIHATGFLPSTFAVMTHQGYQLTVVSKLALDPSPVPSPTPAPTPAPKETLIITATPTGFLRVRAAPSKTATEVAQVRPGDEFTLLEEDNGWYKIDYAPGQEGWVSGEFVKIQ